MEMEDQYEHNDSLYGALAMEGFKDVDLSKFKDRRPAKKYSDIYIPFAIKKKEQKSFKYDGNPEFN